MRYHGNSFPLQVTFGSNTTATEALNMNQPEGDVVAEGCV